MKNILLWISIPAVLALTCGCMGDNYTQPDASLYGKVIDAATGSLILQDIGSDGSRLEVIEQGFEVTSSRYLNFKTDGTYCEKNLFKGQYLIKANRTNFVPIDEQIVDVNGETEFNITALPYCNVEVVSLEFLEDKQRVEAKFTVTCNTSHDLKEVGLFCDPNKNVSNSINNFGDRNCKVNVGRRLSAPETFSIKMPVTALEDSTMYYFRLGAHTSAAEAKWNYSEAVPIMIFRKEIPVKEKGVRWEIFDSIDKWEKHKTVDQFYWDDKDFKVAPGSLAVVSETHEGGGAGYTQFLTPGESGSGVKPVFDASGMPFEGLHMLLTLFVSDANHFEKSANGQIEIGSAGIFDQEEICWTFAQFDLRDGWQTIDLSLPEGNAMGSLRPAKINWFRFYHLQEIGPTTVKFNEVRFYYKTLVDACDDETDWKGKDAVVLDEEDFKQGEACVSTSSKDEFAILSKVFKKPFYAPGRMTDGYFQCWVYVSDAASFNAGSGGQVEITSSGVCDVNELAWDIPTLVNGWNKLTFKLSNGVTRGGDIDLKNVNFFRIWQKVDGTVDGAITLKVDGIRFFREGFEPASEEDD